MDLADYTAVLRRRWLALVICILAGIGGGYYSGHHGAKVYRATATTFLNVPNSGQTINEVLAGVQVSSNLIDTYATLATSRVVAQRVVQQYQLPMSPGELQSKVTATPQKNTFIIGISVRDTDPARAASLADEVAVALSDEVAQLQANRVDPVRVDTLDKAVTPGNPISPKPTISLVLGIVLGILGGLVLAAVVEALDRSVRSSSQVDAILRAPLLAVIPNRRRDRQIVTTNEADSLGEPYRALRTSIRFLDPDHPVSTIIISSPEEGEGKTTLTANLAMAMAKAGIQVIVVDADLRHARLGEVFGVETGAGLTSVVTGDLPLADALQESGENLRILATGPLPPNPSEILGSVRVAEIVAELGTMAETVLIDAPPILPVTDAVVLSTQCDGMMLVARHGKTRRAALAAAKRQVETVHTHLLGYVYNGAPRQPGSGYYYEYTRQGDPAAARH
jgi:capsular exopolysaccharide synthesis family protein